LAFFYFDINDSAKQTARSLLSYLVLSLTAKSNNYAPLERLYMEHNKLDIPTEEELLDLLKELLQSFEQACIVIDALDECDDYYQLFDQVINVMHAWDLLHLHVLMSSRREQNIIITMKECATTEICLSADLVGNDIISYIHSAVAKDPRLRRWGHAVQQHVMDALISGSNGMYVWIHISHDFKRVDIAW
jgi:archaellum biogenesis ATPase FlaH